MNYSVDDTIAAIASAAGRSVRGILRVTGPQTLAVIRNSFQADPPIDWKKVRTPRMVAGELQLPPPLGSLECDVYVWPGMRSYTRQPSAEIHMLGSPPLLNAALRLLCVAAHGWQSRENSHCVRFSRGAGSDPGRSRTGCHRCTQ